MAEYDARTPRARRMPVTEPEAVGATVEAAAATEEADFAIDAGFRPATAVRPVAPGIGQYLSEAAAPLPEPQPRDPRDAAHVAVPRPEPTEATPQAGLAALAPEIVRCPQCGSVQGMFYADSINGTLRHVGCSVARLGQSRQYEVKVSDARKELPRDLT